ncbi:MAG TPA: hypothetical protein VL971_07500 [Rhizomicrobium sp.]|nr:hypothetical protein [Rhizomicrobium sp.]
MRVIAVVVGIGVLTMSQCWAHGRSAPSGPPFQHSEAEPPAPSQPFHDWLQPETHEQKNPYENLSCPELYNLATQSDQSADMAKAFEDKDCHAL